MRNLKFVCDIDGVACAHAESICRWVNKTYSLNSKYEDIITWDYNFGPLDFLDAVKYCYAQPEFILSLNEHDGFKDLLDKLSAKMEVVFATNRDLLKTETNEWIKRKFGKYEVHFVKDKSVLDFNILLDDFPQTILDLSDKKDRVGILIRRPWNNNIETIQEINKYSNLYIVDEYKQVLDIVSDFEKAF